MTIQKIKSGRVTTLTADEFIGDRGIIFYNEELGDLRLGDGVTPGGIPLSNGGSGYILPTASTTIKGGIKVDGNTVAVTNQVLSVVNGVFTTGSYNNPSWLTSLDYSKVSNAPSNLSQFNNDSGFLTSYTESDPTVPSYVKSITSTEISNWNSAYSWGNHALAGYALTTNIKLTGGTSNQILVKKSATNYDYQWEDLIIDPAYTKLIDDSTSGIMYLGEATPNSAESAAVWRIQKIVFDANGNVDSVRYADGGLFNKIWNDRTSLTYS